MGANFKVNEDETEVSQNYPSVAMDSLGNFVIVWEDKRNGNIDIYLQRFTANGERLGSNLKINDDEGRAKQTEPKISMDGDGKFVVTWEDLRNGYSDIYGKRFLANGVRFGSNFRVTTSGYRNQFS